SGRNGVSHEMHYSAGTGGVGGSVRLPRRRVGPRASLIVVSSGYRGPGAVDVVGAAIVCDGRVLAARRGGPADVRGGWELPGGKGGGTVRVGRTVRRATGPWSPAVHALLAHLTAAGLAEAPRVLGIDSAGREALTFLPGRVADPDGAGRPVGEALLAEAMR